MGHIDVSAVSYSLADGSPLLDDVSLRVGDGAKTALIGPNGAGKSTLVRLISGELNPDEGKISRSGSLGVMRQFIGSIRDDSTVKDLLVSLASAEVREIAGRIDELESRILDGADEKTHMDYAQALSDWSDVRGYEYEVLWDVCATQALGVPFSRAQYREVNTLSGGEQKRLALEALLRGPDPVLLLDEPDNYLDVPAKRWLEESLLGSPKTVLFISHDRELLSSTASRIATLEPGTSGNKVWVHSGRFASYHEARRQRLAKLEEDQKRWDEEHEKLRKLMLMYKQKAAYNSDMASRYQSATTRLRRFEQAGPPEQLPAPQKLTMRLSGNRTAKRAITCKGLELTGLMKPFDLEVLYGERVTVLGSNGSGKSHFLRLLAAGGSEPSDEHAPVGEIVPEPVSHIGNVSLGARVRPGWFAQTHNHPSLIGQTLLQILHRGDEHRAGMGREEASRALGRYGLAKVAENVFENISGGQQARFQILLLELSGANLLLLDEPTDNLDLFSAEALEHAIDNFDGTVVTVTHDRWFAERFDRHIIFSEQGAVYESDRPVWDEARVHRSR